MSAAPRYSGYCLVFGLFGALGCAREAPAPKAERTAVRVRTRTLEPKDVPCAQRRTGRASPQRQVALAFGVPGRVRSVRFDVGDRVKAGALLAAVDTEALSASVETAAAQVEQAERELARAERLRASKAIAQQLVDQRKSQVRLASAGLRAARAQLSQARVTAPFSADVVARMMEPGAWANPGMPVLQLAVLDPIRVVVHVTDQTRSVLSVGAKAQLRARGLSAPIAGQIARIAPAVDPQSGLFKVEIDAPNPDRVIGAGQPVEVSIDCRAFRGVYRIEPDWVVYRYDGPSVVMVEQGRARSVRLGEDAKLEEGRFLVAPDRLPKLPLIVQGQHLARDGEDVEVLSP